MTQLLTRHVYGLFFGMAVILAPADICRAEVLASDNASDPAYTDDWQGVGGLVPGETGADPDNGGFGFLPWDFSGSAWDSTKSPYSQPHFIDTDPSPQNDLGAPAFTMTNSNAAYFVHTSFAARSFAEAMGIGDQVKVDLDNPVMAWLSQCGDAMDEVCAYDTTGFIVSLLTAPDVDDLDGDLDVTERFERFGFFTFLWDNPESHDWRITDSRGETLSDFTDEEGSGGFGFAFTLTGEETYELTLTPRGGGEVVKIAGELANPEKGDIERIVFVLYGHGSGNGVDEPTGERELYFNNLVIESLLQKPGDCNQDGTTDLSDAVCLLGHLFQAMPPNLPCEGGTVTDAGNVALLDSNGDASIDLSDAG